jgi:hypothetical protein
MVEVDGRWEMGVDGSAAAARQRPRGVNAARLHERADPVTRSLLPIILPITPNDAVFCAGVNTFPHIPPVLRSPAEGGRIPRLSLAGFGSQATHSHPGVNAE